MAIVIPLTRGLSTVIDDEDAAWAAFKWYALANFNTNYAVREHSHRQAGRHQFLYLHRVILNAPRGVQVDHRDRDGLNNQRSNLRLATNSQNTAHTGLLSRANHSGFRGVSWTPKGSKWVTQIGMNGGTVRIGIFANIEDAARAYDRAAILAFGEFATLNFPDERP